jgi:hypothetical protein
VPYLLWSAPNIIYRKTRVSPTMQHERERKREREKEREGKREKKRERKRERERERVKEREKERERGQKKRLLLTAIDNAVVAELFMLGPF